MNEWGHFTPCTNAHAPPFDSTVNILLLDSRKMHMLVSNNKKIGVNIFNSGSMVCARLAVIGCEQNIAEIVEIVILVASRAGIIEELAHA